MEALRQLVNWSQVPDSTSIPIPSTAPFGDVAMQELINLNLPEDRWLVDKLKAVNKVVSQGYPLVVSRVQFMIPIMSKRGVAIVSIKGSIEGTDVTMITDGDWYFDGWACPCENMMVIIGNDN